MKHNPYFQELLEDIRMDKLTSFHKLFNEEEYGRWLHGVLEEHDILSSEWIDVIYSTFTDDQMIKYLVAHIQEQVNQGDTNTLLKLIKRHIHDQDSLEV